MKVHCAYDTMELISTLKPHPRNSNIHSKEQIERLAKILEYQGFRYPIKISKRSGFVVSGHGRIEAARLNGWEAVPAVWQDYESDDQEISDLIADNSIASWAELDLSIVNDCVKDLDPTFDIELLGIKNFEIDVVDKFLEDEDSVPDIPKEPKNKPGDLYVLGSHRLLCGDSTDPLCVERLMDGHKADMVFTDPPYGVSYQKKTQEIANQSKTRFTSKIHGDDLSVDDLKDVIKSVFHNIYSVLAEKSSYYICSPQGGELGLMMMMMMMQDACIPCRHMIIWVKNAPVFSMGRLDYDYRHEPILYGWSKNKTHEFFGNGDLKNSVWDISREANKLHPTMKPVAIPENAIKNSTKSGGVVIDFFGGSGSTLIAAEKTGRKSFIMEIDPHYCDVIIERWQKFTGKTANRLTDLGELVPYGNEA